MKKIKNVLLLSVLLFIASCTSNDTNTTLTETDLIGSWNVTDFHSENGSISASQNGVTFTAEYQITGSNFNAQVVFADNPKIVSGSGSFTMTASYTALGQTETETENIDSNNNPSNFSGMNWTLQNGNIALTENGRTVYAEVLSFDGNTLELKTALDNTINEQGVNGTITGSIFITLTK